MVDADGRRRGNRTRSLVLTSILAGAVIAVLALIGVANTRAIPIIRTATLQVDGLARNTAPMRVALLADIHFGNHAMQPDRLDAIVRQVNAARPDLVLLAGDFVTAPDTAGATGQARALVHPLKQLLAPLGAVAVLGNHDNEAAPAAVRDALIAAGITVLENQAVQRGPLAIIGIGDRYSGHDNLPAALTAAARTTGAPIVLTHSPDVAPDLPASLPLVLAGHTHCGQIVIPGVGSLATRAWANHGRLLYNPRYMCGMVVEHARTTIVTAGVGAGSVPIRINAMPDWWLLTLAP